MAKLFSIWETVGMLIMKAIELSGMIVRSVAWR